MHIAACINFRACTVNSAMHAYNRKHLICYASLVSERAAITHAQSERTATDRNCRSTVKPIFVTNEDCSMRVCMHICMSVVCMYVPCVESAVKALCSVTIVTSIMSLRSCHRYHPVVPVTVYLIEFLLRAQRARAQDYYCCSGCRMTEE